MFSDRLHFPIRPLGRNLLYCGALILLLHFPARASQNVTLAWNTNGDTNIIAYNIYYGTSSQEYYASLTVSSTNQVTITGLDDGTTYYFAATAINSVGQESDYSAEAVAVTPLLPITLNALTSSDGEFDFNVSGSPYRLYVIQASTNLVDWDTIGYDWGPSPFADYDAASYTQRFYRAYDYYLYNAALAAAAAATPAQLTDLNNFADEFSFTVNGAAGQQYTVQASTDLVN